MACRYPNGDAEAVAWDDLQAVLIETNDEGPFAPDLFWILVGRPGGCILPQGAAGEDELLRRLQALDGFDNDAVSAAMSSTENQPVLCWKRPVKKVSP